MITGHRGRRHLAALPEAVGDALHAVNARDTPLFLECLESAVTLDYFGRKIVGVEAVERWFVRWAVAQRTELSNVIWTREGDVLALRARVTDARSSSALTLSFTLSAAGLVSALRFSDRDQ